MKGPTIRSLRDVNNAVHRAKQHKQLAIQFKKIPVENLTICAHSDAAWANVGAHTQAGYIIAFTDKKLHHGQGAPWVPVVWKSYKLPRAVSSTLAGESQAMSVAGGTVEWLNLLLSEAIDGPFNLRDARKVLATRQPLLATDCPASFVRFLDMSLSKSDLEAFQQIVAKTKGCGMLEALRDQVDGQLGGSPASDFTLISDQAAGMSDASKRRATTEIADLQRPLTPGSMCTGYGNQKGKVSGETRSDLGTMPVSQYQGIFPEGITSFEEWGRTRIDFGKFANQSMTYYQLAVSQKVDCVTYKSWCLQRVKTSTGLLKDMTDYLVEYDRLARQQYGPEAGHAPFIPGTDRVRVLM
eukprot:s3983_g3.t1